jgi:hypothetical protein
MKLKEKMAKKLYEGKEEEQRAFIMGFDSVLNIICLRYKFFLQIDEPGIIFHSLLAIKDEETNE